MRRSVSPEDVQAAERQRAAMAAATRVQGVLIPPGTSVVILSYDGPVDVTKLHNALGRMIAENDPYGLPAEALEPAPLATGGEITGPVFRVGDGGCVLQSPADDGDAHEYSDDTDPFAIPPDASQPSPVADSPEQAPVGTTSAEAFEQATRPFHEHALAVQAKVAEQFTPAFAAAAQAMAAIAGDGRTVNAEEGSFPAIGPAHVYGDPDGSRTPPTPLERLRILGPATAAQLAAALDTTRQKAAKELAALVAAGQAVKDGGTYTAASVEQEPAAEQGGLQPEQ